jgi:hypothetical protein
MMRRAIIVFTLVLTMDCRAPGPSAQVTSDAALETGDAPDDVVTDVTGEPAAAGEVEESTDTLDAPAPAPDASSMSDAAAESRAFNPASWTNIYTTLLDNMSYASNCTGEGCHNPGTQKGLDLSTLTNGYASVQAKLVPGDPKGSTIVNKLEAGDMPRGRPKMPVADLELIKAWIQAGAAND